MYHVYATCYSSDIGNMIIAGNANRRKYNVGLLKDPRTREGYKLNLANKSQVLQERHEEEPDLNSQWQNAKQTLTSTCQEVVDLKKQHQKDWVTAETWRRIQVRKEKKSAVNNSQTRAAKAKEVHTAANREVQIFFLMDKQNYVESGRSWRQWKRETAV